MSSPPPSSPVGARSSSLAPAAHAAPPAGAAPVGAVSDDEINTGLEVRKTANDAILSKLSSAQLGYFTDPFITCFAHPAQPNRPKHAPSAASVPHPAFPVAIPSPPTVSVPAAVPSAERVAPFLPPPAFVRRSPLINRGYYSRVQALDQLIAEFVAVARANGLPAQVVSLGAGFDTTYWRLKHAAMTAAGSDSTGAIKADAPDYYVEIDFESSMSQKLAIIEATPELQDVLAAPHPTSACPAPAASSGAASGPGGASSFSWSKSPVHGTWDDFALIGADLRDLATLEARLRTHTRLDFSAPTIFLSECVLVYMPPEASAEVLRWAGDGKTFTGPVVLATYEQIHPNDPFGRTMMANLTARGCPLLGLPAYPDLQAQRKRFLGLGFQRHGGWSMNDIYGYYISKDSLRKAEKLEMFDEFEEWHLIQGHYCISVGARDGTTVSRATHAPAVPAPAAPAPMDTLPAEPYTPPGAGKATSAAWFDEIGYIEKAPPRRVAGKPGPARSAFYQ